MLYKHPRIKHAPWSKSVSYDDKIMFDYSIFYNRRVIISLKYDGENTSGYYNGISHARSMDSKYHPSRTWFKNWWAERCYKLNFGWRVCGENLFAKHSIHYTDLKSYFYGFGVYNENNVLLNWDDSLIIFEQLEIEPVEVVFDGIFTKEFARELQYGKFDYLLNDQNEGYVIRLADEINYDDFSNSVMKVVRDGHVQTNEHWMNSEIIPNELRK